MISVALLSSCSNDNKSSSSENSTTEYSSIMEPPYIGEEYAFGDSLIYNGITYELGTEFAYVTFDKILFGILENDALIQKFSEYYPDVDYIIDSNFKIWNIPNSSRKDETWFLAYSIVDISSEYSIVVTNIALDHSQCGFIYNKVS